MPTGGGFFFFFFTPIPVINWTWLKHSTQGCSIFCRIQKTIIHQINTSNCYWNKWMKNKLNTQNPKDQMNKRGVYVSFTIFLTILKSFKEIFESVTPGGYKFEFRYLYGQASSAWNSYSYNLQHGSYMVQDVLSPKPNYHARNIIFTLSLQSFSY